MSLRAILLAFSFGFSAGGCGLPPGVAVSNESVPASAVYLTAGAFSGNDVSGNAQVFLNASRVLLHLEGLVTPIGSNYAVFLEDGNPAAPFYSSMLKTSQGNQNYATGLPVSATHFSRVVIRTSNAPAAPIVATATLAPYF